MAQFLIGAEAGEEEVIVFDATVRENHQDGALAAQYPVERGVDATDHVQPFPAILTLDVALSDVPVFRPGGTETFPTKVVKNDDGSSSDVIDTGEVDRVREVYSRLLELKDSGTPLRVVTSRRDYGRMILTNIDAPTDVTTGQGLDLILGLQQQFVGTSETVTVTRTTSPRHKPPTDGGSQGKTKVGDGVSIGAQRDVLSSVAGAF